MDFYGVLDFIESENISPADKFMQRTMLASLKWLKEQFSGRNVDEISYGELVKVFSEAWPESI